jgi:hypothetical protein
MPRANATVDPTITTTEKAVFQSSRHVVQNGLDAGGLITAPGDGSPAKAIKFKCPSGSAATLRVRIPGIHNAGQYAHIKATEADEFVLTTSSGTGALDVAYVSTVSGTATYNFTVIA